MEIYLFVLMILVDKRFAILNCVRIIVLPFIVEKVSF